MYASTESDREYARNAGWETPEQAWVLAPSDSWERNPHYSGPAVPHPEDDTAFWEEWQAHEMIVAQDVVETGGPSFDYFSRDQALVDDEIPW